MTQICSIFGNMYKAKGKRVPKLKHSTLIYQIWVSCKKFRSTALKNLVCDLHLVSVELFWQLLIAKPKRVMWRSDIIIKYGRKYLFKGLFLQ